MSLTWRVYRCNECEFSSVDARRRRFGRSSFVDSGRNVNNECSVRCIFGREAVFFEVFELKERRSRIELGQNVAREEKYNTRVSSNPFWFFPPPPSSSSRNKLRRRNMDLSF